MNRNNFIKRIFFPFAASILSKESKVENSISYTDISKIEGNDLLGIKNVQWDGVRFSKVSEEADRKLKGLANRLGLINDK